MHQIRHLLTIDTEQARVYAAITEREGLQSWWTPDVEAQPVAGTTSTFRFRSGATSRMEIRALDAPQRVEWRCVDGAEEWIGTGVIFNLEDQNGRTIVRFSHLGWQEISDFFASCSYQWGLYLKSLKDYCETGRGAPDS